MKIEIVNFTKVLPANLYLSSEEYQRTAKSFDEIAFGIDELFIVTTVTLQGIRVPNIIFVPVSKLDDFVIEEKLRIEIEDEIEIARLRMKQAERRKGEQNGNGNS